MRNARWLMVLAIPALMIPASPASATTHNPCQFHGAGAPSVDYLNGDGTSTLYGTGSIGGCPLVTTTTSESVSVRVAMQHLEDGVWVDKDVATFTRGWNRYSRFTRQAGGSVTAICEVGDWRVDVTGGDGWSSTEWASQVVTFAPGDSGVCGGYGGGD